MTPLVILCLAALVVFVAVDLSHRFAHVRCELCARPYAAFRRWAARDGVRRLRQLCWRCTWKQHRLEEVR